MFRKKCNALFMLFKDISRPWLRLSAAINVIAEDEKENGVLITHKL